MSGAQIVYATQIKSMFNDQFDVTAACPTGKKAIGGGVMSGTYTSGIPEWLVGADGPKVTSSAPKDDLSGWVGKAARGGSLADQIVRVYAICVLAP